MAESIPLVARASAHAGRIAIAEGSRRLRYAELLELSSRAASRLHDARPGLAGERVAFLIPPGEDYVIAQWGIWRAGAIAVPLCTSHPEPELEYTVADSEAAVLIGPDAPHPALSAIAARRGLPLLPAHALRTAAPRSLPAVPATSGAMLIYTSGTTGKPKGVLSTHAIFAAQIRSVVEAWEMVPEDRLLHVLPLHHLHGVLNALACPLWAGAACEFLPRFDPERVWHRIAAEDGPTLFMGVPTMYAKLAQAFDAASPSVRDAIRAGCRRMRLMVSGSAALPVSLLETFRAQSGHTLLERYGMTEFGMGLGNPLHGERRPGHVGVPFPGVEVRLVGESGSEAADGEAGKLEVRGPGVFREYWRRPDATREAFTADGWFKTGDVALRARGAYRILGRESVDILKSGGFKLSALEIEECLREHPAIRECAVVGVADAVWGQRVAAAVVLHDGARLTLEELRAWGKERLSPYKVPTLLLAVEDFPRNPMGKVLKPELAKLFG